MGIAIIVIVVVVIVDTSIPVISRYTGSTGSSFQSILLFLCMVSVYAFGQAYVLRFVRSKLNFSNQQNTIVYLHKIVSFIQYVLIAIMTIIIFQILFQGIYSSTLLKIIVSINFILSSILFGYFGIRLFLWNRFNKNLILLTFMLAILALTATSLITVIYIMNQFGGQRSFEYIFPMKSVQIIIAGANNSASLTFLLASIISFVMTWIASVVLMKHFSLRIGKIKYWILVFIPLVYFLSQFQSFFPIIFQELRIQDPIMYGIIHTLFFSSSKPVGGILFGLAFWSITKGLRESTTKDYILIAAWGMILFFTVNQPAILTLFPYPPFGVPTICFIGLSSYLVLVGIYSSTISIASDEKLLREVRKLLPIEYNLLSNIVTANEVKRMQEKAVIITNQLADKITKETGISSSLEEQDIKDYVVEILKETKKLE